MKEENVYMPCNKQACVLTLLPHPLVSLLWQTCPPPSGWQWRELSLPLMSLPQAPYLWYLLLEWQPSPLQLCQPGLAWDPGRRAAPGVQLRG